MKLTWLKLSTDILSDEKIERIRALPEGDSLFVLWIGILTLGMKSPSPGTLEITPGFPFTIEDLSRRFHLPVNTVRMGIDAFHKLLMITVVENDTIKITKFLDHQEVEKILDYRERERQRKAEYRERKKLEGPSDAKKIFDAWNEAGVITHKAMDDAGKRKVNSAIEKHGVEPFLKAIKNYAAVLAEPKRFFFTYKWTLWDFSKRGVDKFVDEADPLKNFLRDKQAGAAKRDAKYYGEGEGRF